MYSTGANYLKELDQLVIAVDEQRWLAFTMLSTVSSATKFDIDRPLLQIRKRGLSTKVISK